jgi:hypothetical protein
METYGLYHYEREGEGHLICAVISCVSPSQCAVQFPLGARRGINLILYIRKQRAKNDDADQAVPALPRICDAQESPEINHQVQECVQDRFASTENQQLAKHFPREMFCNLLILRWTKSISDTPTHSPLISPTGHSQPADFGSRKGDGKAVTTWKKK